MTGRRTAPPSHPERPRQRWGQQKRVRERRSKNPARPRTARAPGVSDPSRARRRPLITVQYRTGHHSLLPPRPASLSSLAPSFPRPIPPGPVRPDSPRTNPPAYPRIARLRAPPWVPEPTAWIAPSLPGSPGDRASLLAPAERILLRVPAAPPARPGAARLGSRSQSPAMARARLPLPLPPGSCRCSSVAAAAPAAARRLPGAGR